MMTMTTRVALLLATSGVLGGCGALHTPYVRPVMPAPAVWEAGIDPAGAPASVAATGPSGAWWTAFRDPALDQLVSDVIARNNNLAAAAVRLRRARLQAGLAGNALTPQLSGGGSASGSRPFDGGDTTRSFALSGSVAYEIDLFNRLGSLRDAADWEARATAEDLEATRLALVGTAATLYFQRLQLGDRLRLADASLAYARRTLALVEAQYAAGGVSALERAEATRAVETQEAQRTQIVQQAAEAENALVVLLDGGRAEPAPRSIAEVALPPVDAGVPASLLARRPDLRAAEARLRGGLANVDATTASFYPGFSLTGTAGGSSSTLTDLLSNPVGTLLSNVTLPFLNVERARLSRGISRTQFDEGVATFRQSYRQALADVENALSARTQLRTQADRLELALDNAREAERLYEVRYRSGAVALRDWLAAQETRRQIEASLLDNRLARLSNHVQLLQALGGDIPAGEAP